MSKRIGIGVLIILVCGLSILNFAFNLNDLMSAKSKAEIREYIPQNLEGDWYYYHEIAVATMNTYGDCRTVENEVYTVGFEDGATNGVAMVMENMVINGNEIDGYTVEINGEQFYYEP